MKTKPKNSRQIFYLIIGLLAVGGVDAYVCPGTGIDYDTENITFPFSDITFNYPINESTVSSPVEFSLTDETCHTFSGNTYSQELIAETPTTQYINRTNYPTTNTTRLVSLNLDDGTYNYSVNMTAYSLIAGGGLRHYGEFTTPDYPYLLTVTSTTDVGEDTGGACLTPYGYELTGIAAAASDYVLLDLTNVQQYCVDTSCNNTLVLGPDYYVDADYKILINTTQTKPWSFYIGGFNYNFGNVRRSETPDETETPTNIEDFTANNNVYWVTLRNQTGDLFDFGDSTTYDINIFCDEYAPDTINIDTGFQKTELLISTKEIPVFQSQVVEGDGLTTREYEPYIAVENFTLYQFPPARTHIGLTFLLEDYTAAFSESYLKVRQNINGTIEIITQRQWYNNQVGPISIINNTDIQYILYTPTETRVIAWDLATSTSDRTVVVRKPSFTDQTSYLDGVDIGITGSYGDNSITLTWDVSVGNCTNASLTVKNYTSSNLFESMEVVSLEDANSGTIDITLFNNNQTYYAIGELTTSEYGTIKIDRLVTPAITEERFPFYDSFALPASILGLTKAQWYTMASIFFISVVAFTFSASEVGVGGLIVVAVIGGSKFWGWFREMTWDLWLFLAVIAIAYAFVSGRRKLE